MADFAHWYHSSIIIVVVHGTFLSTSRYSSSECKVFCDEEIKETVLGRGQLVFQIHSNNMGEE